MRRKKQQHHPNAASLRPELSRDIYGFALPPQHLEKYKKYIEIYKEEEEERSEKWNQFLEVLEDSCPKREDSNQQQSNGKDRINGTNKVRSWSEIRPCVAAIERSLSLEKNWSASLLSRKNPKQDINYCFSTFVGNLRLGSPAAGDSEDDFFDTEISNSFSDSYSTTSSNSDSASNSARSGNDSCTWREELESLVHGGVPMALRGELWQAFVGSNAWKIDGYYNSLLAQELDGENRRVDASDDVNDSDEPTSTIDKWTSQIEKDLPRTFPGHPALEEDGRNALRRLLTAYALHNPSIGYCQAMNFIGGLLLLLMSEENAFWTLTCIMEDYFHGYYSEEMVEAQVENLNSLVYTVGSVVDQLVFEEIVRECFPKLVSHLDKLGIQIALVTGSWFLSVFVNILPWESVLRVWDVLLYKGNRTMLFRTALALIDLHGPILLATKDAGDAVSLFQSLAASTFDSSQLVLTACTGYQRLNESKLQDLREICRPKVLATVHCRVMNNIPSSARAPQQLDDNVEKCTSLTRKNRCKVGLVGTSAIVIPFLQKQVKLLKNEMCQALEEKKAAIKRTQELEKMIKNCVTKDSTSMLAAKVDDLDLVLCTLKKKISEKEMQEQALLQVMMQIEEKQRISEDRRRSAEQSATEQTRIANEFQEKYERAISLLARAEKRALIAESKLKTMCGCHNQH